MTKFIFYALFEFRMYRKMSQLEIMTRFIYNNDNKYINVQLHVEKKNL